MDEQYIIDLKVKTPGVVSATKKIKELEAEMAKLDKTSESYKQKQIEVGRVQNAAGESTKKLGSVVNDAKSSVGNLTAGLGGLAGGALAVGTALVKAGQEVLAIEKRFASLKKEVGRTSGLLGGNLDKAAISITALATTFNKETSEINKAADAFAKQTGTSYVQALELIEKGFLQGADANGDFLDKLREYPIQFKEAGFSAEEFIKIASQEVRGGIFGDKLLDSVKELGLSIRELDKAQTDALTGAFGSAFTTDFVARVNSGKLSVKDALGVIITESKKAGLSVQATQKLTADLFKGAGEDAGGFKVIIEQLIKAQEINLDVLDKLGESQKEQLRLQTDLAEQELKLANAFDGLSKSVSDFTIVAKTELLSVLNAVIESLDLANTKTNRLAKAYTDGFSTKPIEDVNAEILSLESSQADLIRDAGLLREAISDTYNPLKLREFYSQLYASEENRVRIEKQLGLLREIQVKKQGEGAKKDADDTKTNADAKLKSEEDRKKAQDAAKKRQEDEKKRLEDLIKLEKERFNQLKKSFEDNFEGQRLEAQKLFAAGLINETELKDKVRQIDEQEIEVLLTIIKNKKEVAKTGDEALEISKLELEALTLQKQVLDEQLEIRKRLRDIQDTATQAEDTIAVGENEIDKNNEIQESIRRNATATEKKKQKDLEAIKLKYENIERKRLADSLQKQRKDAAEALAIAQKAADDATLIEDDASTEKGKEAIEKLIDAKLKLLEVDVKISNNQTDQVQADADANKTASKILQERADQAQKIAGYINQVTDIFKQAIQADIQAIDEKLSVQESRISAGVELAKMGNDELLNQELERQDKLLEEKEKLQKKENALNAIQTAANVAAAGLQAAANIAVAVTKAAAQSGLAAPVGIATTLGAIGIGLGAVTGLIAGFFADGVINFQGKGTERSDSNIVAISKGESVITAKGTKNASKMLTLINEGKLSDSDYLTAGLDLNPIQTINQQIDMRNEMNQQIALSKELLEEMRQFHTKIEFTDKGMEQYIQTKNKRITKINNR